MKTSSKVLLGSFAGLLAVPLVFLLALRVCLETPADAEAPPTRTRSSGSRTIAMADFTGVELKGHWEVEMTRGEPESIVVEGPEDLLAGLTTRRRGADTLAMEMPQRPRGKRKLRATIVCPFLHSLRTKGVVDLELAGYDTHRLSVLMEGVTSVRARGSRVGDLRLKSQGVSRIDLRNNPVENADVDCEGVTKLRLTMAGGELTGRVKGVGELEYGGEVSRVSVSKEGPFKVARE